MKLNHIHANVKDFPAALEWMERVWEVRPTFQNERMATFQLEQLVLILDAADHDSVLTLGFESSDCDADFRRVVSRGAIAIENPADKPWGVRAAYLKGPGALKFEIEQLRSQPAV